MIRVERPDRPLLERAYGLADQRHEIPNETGTRFGIASGTKSLTALTVVSLIEEGQFELSTTARSLLGDDLPLIADDVTIEHLLSHRSGIGDYLDEETELDFDAYLMPVPVQELATTEQYLSILGGHPTKFPAGERFGYCNSGFVVLALIAERVSGMPFPELVRISASASPPAWSTRRSCAPTSCPGSAAIGYLRGRRGLEDERLPSARAGHGRRRDLHDGRRRQRPLAWILRGQDRLARVGRGARSRAKRGPVRVGTRADGGTASASGFTPRGTSSDERRGHGRRVQQRP